MRARTTRHGTLDPPHIIVGCKSSATTRRESVVCCYRKTCECGWTKCIACAAILFLPGKLCHRLESPEWQAGLGRLVAWFERPWNVVPCFRPCGSMSGVVSPSVTPGVSPSMLPRNNCGSMAPPPSPSPITQRPFSQPCWGVSGTDTNGPKLRRNPLPGQMLQERRRFPRHGLYCTQVRNYCVLVVRPSSDLGRDVPQRTATLVFARNCALT